MFNRRIIRIKVLQILFSYYSEALNSLQEAEKDLKFAFDRTYDLYFFIMLLIVEFGNYSNLKIEKAKNKFIPSDEDLNPNTKFVNNKLIDQLKKNEHLNSYIKSRKYTWTKNPEFLKALYDEFVKTDEYQNYLNSSENTYDIDKKIIIYFVNDFLYNSDVFYSQIEEESIYWIDSTDFVIKRVVKSLEKFTEKDDFSKKLMEKFKNDDDYNFGLKLLHKTILKKDDYTTVVQNNIINWDYERVSYVDRMILQLAIAELLDFDEIPVKVTFNEYIEIAKSYGIQGKSPNFINGLLDKILKDLKDNQRIKKSGRGLKDN